MENKSSNWDQHCCNIFRVCHRVQTLTQTVCPFRSGVTQAGPAPLIVHLGTKAEHMYVYTHTHTHKYSQISDMSFCVCPNRQACTSR